MKVRVMFIQYFLSINVFIPPVVLLHHSTPYLDYTWPQVGSRYSQFPVIPAFALP